MSMLTMTGLGVAAGLHGALYGAYKDSPHESFRWHRFMREIVFALAATAVLASCSPAATTQSAFTIYLTVFALTRIVTEFWKLFVRVEPQEGFRIPTQIHWVAGVVHNPVVRLLLGCGFVASIYGCYAAFKTIPDGLPLTTKGLLVGLGIGTAEAIAGGYKDGAIEGFSSIKFVKSPSFGMIGGLIASGHTTNTAFLLLSTIGSMRMFLELLFKMLAKNYTPGKFRAMTGPFKDWYIRRERFVAPYAATWLLYLLLCSHPNW
jgi:hypothetical protein